MRDKNLKCFLIFYPPFTNNEHCLTQTKVPATLHFVTQSVYCRPALSFTELKNVTQISHGTPITVVVWKTRFTKVTCCSVVNGYLFYTVLHDVATGNSTLPRVLRSQK
jgi:hypothetical protein